MALEPLPSPIVDTGTTSTITLSGTVEVNAGGGNYYWHNNKVDLGLNGGALDSEQWHLWSFVRDEGVFPAHHWFGDLYVRFGTPLGGWVTYTEGTLLQTLDLGVGATPDETQYYAAVSFSATLGVFRLGAELAILGGMMEPYTAESTELRLAWFADEFATHAMTVGGQTATTYALSGSETPAPPFSPPGEISGWLGRQVVTGESNLATPGGIAAKIRTYTMDWGGGGNLLDTEGMDGGLGTGFVPVADGDFDLIDSASAQFAPGASLQYDVTVIDFGGGAQTPDLLDNWLTDGELYGAVPKIPDAANVPTGVNSYTATWNTDWERSHKNPPAYVEITVDPAWLVANGWDANDTPVNLDQPSPLTGAATYSPIALAHASPLPVDIPDGARPSHWVSSDGAKGTVTENPGDTVYTVVNAAVLYTRAFASSWRSLVNPGDPAFVLEGYRLFEHAAGTEDIWWWNAYGFLHLAITASAPATLTLQVDGVRLQVTDGHDGAPAWTQEVVEKRTYTAALLAGANDVWLDLGWPGAFQSDSGAEYPMERPRVDTLTLSFSAAGTFTMSTCALSRRDAYQPSLSLAYSRVSSYNTEYPAILVRVDGEETPALSIPDDASKGMEQEAGFGGATRHTALGPLPGTASALLVSEMWAPWEHIDGFTCAYSAAAGDAFLTDAYGQRLAPEYGFWCKELPDTSFTAGAISPAHAIRCGRMTFPNALTSAVIVRARKVVGGGAEAVATVAGARAGAGVSVALRDGAGALIATPTTDARGRVKYAPLGDGLTVTWGAP